MWLRVLRIDPDRLAALNLSPGDVHAALQRNNYLAAVGQTKGNQVQVNLLANTDLRSVDEFANLIVADRGGAIVRLSDVARVELGAEEADLIAKYNRAEGVYLGVWPLVGANEIEVARRLREEMERIRPTLPKDIEMRLVWDGTMFMRDALKEITKTLAETIAIVGVVVFLFMGSVRTALVPLVAMPVSLLGAAVVMLLLGFSFNLLTILAIVLSVGLVVDDAIVVVENVERHVREGKTRIQAAMIGARELLGPIIAMTITLAAVYAPIGIQGGMVPTDSLVERFGLFTIIVLGEVVLGVVNGLSGAERDVKTIVTGMLALGLGFGFWWIYFDLDGRRLPRNQGTAVANWALSHLPITGSIAAAAVVANLSPPALRGRYQGAFSMSWGVAFTIAPVLGGEVLTRAGAPTAAASSAMPTGRPRSSTSAFAAGTTRPSAWAGIRPRRVRRAPSARPHMNLRVVAMTVGQLPTASATNSSTVPSPFGTVTRFVAR